MKTCSWRCLIFTHIVFSVPFFVSLKQSHLHNFELLIWNFTPNIEGWENRILFWPERTVWESGWDVLFLTLTATLLPPPELLCGFFFFPRQRKVCASQECGLVSQRLPHSGYGSDSKQHSIFVLDIILAAGRSATLQPWKTGGFRETVNTAHVDLSQLGIYRDEYQKMFCDWRPHYLCDIRAI